MTRVLEVAARTLRSGVVVVPHGIARGLQIDANGENASYALGTNEPLVQDVFLAHVRPGAVVYDIGANIGFFTLVAARLTGPTGRVFAFEPVPVTADRLAANVALNRLDHVEILRVGVGRTAGTAALVSSGTSQTASLSLSEDHRPLGVLDIQVMALDDLLREGRLLPPSFVKMDIEGAEVEALLGMANVLAEHRPVVLCEVHDTHEAVADFFEAHAYDVTVVETGGALRGSPDLVHALAMPRLA